MAKIIGRTSVLGIAKEATRGTAESSASYFVPIQALDFDDKVEYVDNDSAMGSIIEKNDARITKLWAEGQYEGKVFLNSIGVELVSLFGGTPTSTQRTTTGVYDHVYALTNSNSHKSMTLFYEDGLQEVKFALAMIDTWSLECAVDDFVKRTVKLLSKKSGSASITSSYTDEIEFIPSQITFKQASAQSGLDAADPISITNFQFEVAKNAEAAYVLGSNEPDDINNKQFAVTGSFELYFESTTQRTQVLTDLKKAMRIGMKDTATIIGSSGSHNPELYFDFHKCKFGEFERGWDKNDILTQKVTFEALLSISDSAIMAARLTNTVTSY